MTERRVYQERLLEEQKAVADTSELAVRVADQETSIRAAKSRILALRSQVMRLVKWVYLALHPCRPVVLTHMVMLGGC